MEYLLNTVQENWVKMNSNWGKGWTILYVFIIATFIFMFIDYGRPFIDFLWWITNPLVDLLRIVLG